MGQKIETSNELCRDYSPMWTASKNRRIEEHSPEDCSNKVFLHKRHSESRCLSYTTRQRGQETIDTNVDNNLN